VSGPRVLLIEHERATPAGLVAEWLDGRRADVHAVPIDEGATPDPLDSYDLIVALGSEFSAYDDHLPWLGKELELMRKASNADIPILGICFGGQLLARALGGDVFRAAEAEIGWFDVESAQGDLIAGGPWFQWHFDTFTVPMAATRLAHNHVGPQAFTHGRSLGVQFHPEVGVEIMENWAIVYKHELDEHGVSADELLERTRAVAEDATNVSWALLEGFYERIARLGNGRTT
jgi:GMP synthase-like glutamine amidotransferase